MATILSLRQRLLDEWAITSAAETMLVDLALLSYYDALRVQGWTDDLAVRIEHEFFGDDAFTEWREEAIGARIVSRSKTGSDGSASSSCRSSIGLTG
jgi:hypothetical protein